PCFAWPVVVGPSAGRVLGGACATTAGRAQALSDVALAAAVRRLVVATIAERVRQVLLLDLGVRMVVRVLVARAVAEPLHERGGGVPEVERNGQGAGPLHVLRRGEHGAVGGIRFW